MVKTHFYLYVALINSFLNIFQRLSPPERAFLIKIFSHSPIMSQEKLLPKVDQLPPLPQCPCAFKVQFPSAPLLLGPPRLPCLPLVKWSCSARLACVLPSPRNPGWLLQSFRPYPVLSLVKYCLALCSVVSCVLGLVPTSAWGQRQYFWLIYMDATQ